MAQSFNLTAQINLQAPANLKTVVAQIRREFSTVSADVKLNISAQSAKSIDNIRTRLESMNAALIQARNNTNALDSALRNLSGSLSSVQASTSKVDSSFGKTATSVGQTAKNIKTATTEMEEFGKQSALAIRRFAAFSVVTSGIFALINAVNSGFQAFVEFDKELVKLQQVTGKGEIGLRGLEKEISNLSTTLGVSSKSLMQVASTLAQAGLSADDTRVALAALAKTELAPSFDNLTDTTEGAIAAIRQFGLEAGDLEKALGSINAVAAAFAVESKDIISAIQRTGGVFAASSRGVSEGTDALNEFIAVFTSIRQTTRESAETIATGLRTIFTRLQRAKTIDQLKEYGVELTDLEGKFVGPYEAVKRLSGALSQLDPRDLRFSSIVEELGGFRQIGKVIPLIQQFKTAQDALAVAQKGQGSLYDAQVTAQKSLANQLAKVREQFLALIRDIGKSQSFQALFKIVTGLASGLISLAGAFKPILPILAIMGAVKGVSAIRQFGSGFMGGLSKGGGARGVGSNMGESLSGAKDKEKEETTSRASDAIRENTSAIKILTEATNKVNTSILKLDDSIRSRPSGGATLNSGGVVRKFARGGLVPGSGDSDSVPAMLMPGEFVIRKKAVATLGAENLHKINKYAAGGRVVQAQPGESIEAAHVGANIPITPEQVRTIVSQSRDKKIFAAILDKSGIQTSGANIKETASNLVQQLDNDQITQLLAKLNLEAKEDILLKIPKSYNQALKRGNPDLVAQKDLSSYIEEHSDSISKLPEFIRKQPGKQKAIADAISTIPAPHNIDGIPAFDQDDELNSLKNNITGGLSVDTLALMFKGASKNFWEQAGLNPARARAQDRIKTKALSQKFVNGGTVQDIAKLQGSSIEQVILSQIQEAGGISGIRKILNISGSDRTPNSILQAGNIKAGKNIPQATDMINSVLKKLQDQGAIQSQSIEAATKVAVVGLQPFNKKATEGPMDLGGVNSVMHIRGLPSKYADAVAQIRDSLDAATSQFAENIQNTDIFGGGEPLAFDFDETLVSGADIFGPDGKPDIPKYSDLNAVAEGLKKGRLTPLGEKLKALLKLNPNFKKNTRILTARPQSTAALLADKLQQLGLPYFTSDVTGVSTGLGSNIAQAKADNLGSLEKLIDDNISNVNTSRASGKSAYAYTEPKSLSDKQKRASGMANIEGAALELVLAKLGAVGGTIQNRAVDFEHGLGPQAAQVFDIDPKWPTEVKRTLGGGSISRAKEEFARYFKEKSKRFALGGQVYDLQKGTGLANGEFNEIVKFANTNDFSMDEFKTYLAKRIQEKKNKSGLMMNPASLLRAITPETQTASQKQLDLASMLKGEVDAKYNPKYDNARKPFAVGGSVEDTVPALLTPGEFVINKKAAQKIGYGQLNKMNKADKLQGYNKGGHVGKFAKGGMVDNASPGGVSERTLQNILKVLQAQEQNASTNSGKELINTIKETIASQSLGTISASEAIVDVAAGIRKLAIESKKSGNDDRAGSLKRVFDALDKIQQGKGGKSLIEATNTRLGINAAQPQTSPQTNSDQFSAFRSAQGGPVADTMGPSTPFPADMMQFTTAVKSATNAMKLVEEEMSYLKARAKESGQTLSGLGKTLASKIAQQANQMIKEQPGKKEDLRTLAIGQRSSLVASQTSGKREDIDKAITDFAGKLKEIDPSVAQETINKAAKALAEGLAQNDSLETITKNSKELSDIFGSTITDAKAIDEAFKKLAETSGFTEEQLRKLTSKDLESQKFVQSDKGKNFGKLAEIAPGLTQKLANTKLGGALSSGADFISGKGGMASKLFAKAGGIAGIGTGVAVAADQAKGFLPLSMQKDPNVQGALGAVGGAASGAASGAMLGAQVAGPVGALVAGVGGAIIGGIQGFFDAKNTTILANTLDKLSKSTSDLDKAFKQLDNNLPDGKQKAYQAFGEVQQSSKELDQIALSKNTFSNYLTRPSDAQKSEALGARIANASTSQETAQRLASNTLKSSSTDELDTILKSVKEGSTGALNPIIEEYKKGAIVAAEAANGAKNLTSAEKKSIGARAEERAALDAYMKSRKEAGATDKQINDELQLNKKNALQQGKEIIRVDAEIATKQELLARATKEVAIETENLLDIYRRVNANIKRYESELDQVVSSMDGMLGDLGGNPTVSKVNRQNEQVLGNLSAYSASEVKTAADNTAGLLGGTSEAKDLANNASAAKILQDQLPAMLRSVGKGQDKKLVVDQLRDMLPQSASIDQVLEEIQKKIDKDTSTDGESIGTLIEDIDNNIIGKFSQTAQEGADTLKNLAQTYANTLQQAIDVQNQYNKVILESNGYMRKAQTIRINAELDLAQALGKNPTLKEMNKAFDTEITSLTSGLVSTGNLSSEQASNPMAIAEGIIQTSNINKGLENKNKILQNSAAVGLTDSPVDTAAREELNRAQLDNIATMGKNKVAIEESRQALEKLANDGSKAANALSKIQARQQLGENARSLGRKLLTSDSGELADFKRQMDTYTKVASGKASNKELGSLQTRRDAFAGLDNLKGLIPESISKQMEARLQRQMIMANPRGQEILNARVGVGEDGKDITMDQALSMTESGKDPVQEKYIAEYKAATDVQIKANEALSLLAQTSAASIQETMGSFETFLNNDFPNIVARAFADARADAQSKPTPEAKAKSDQKKQEKEQQQAADRQKTVAEEVATLETEYKDTMAGGNNNRFAGNQKELDALRKKQEGTFRTNNMGIGTFTPGSLTEEEKTRKTKLESELALTPQARAEKIKEEINKKKTEYEQNKEKLAGFETTPVSEAKTEAETRRATARPVASTGQNETGPKPQVYGSSKPAQSLPKDEKLETDKKAFEEEKKAQEDKKFGAMKNRHKTQQEAWDADTEYNNSQRITQEESDAGFWAGGTIVYDDPVKKAKQEELAKKREARIADARKKKEDADRKAAEAKTTYDSAEQSQKQWNTDNSKRGESLQQREEAERKRIQLEEDRELVSTGQFSVGDHFGASQAMYGHMGSNSYVKYANEDKALREKIARGETLKPEEQAKHDEYRRKEKKYYDNRRAKAEANVATNSGSVASPNSSAAAVTEASVASATKPSVSTPVDITELSNQELKDKVTSLRKQGKKGTNTSEYSQARHTLSYRDKEQNKFRALGAALPGYKKKKDAGEMSKAEYNAHVESYGQMKKDREKQTYNNKPTTNEGITPYQQAQNAKREAYLARFKPEVREKMMTPAEKRARAESASSVAANTSQPGTPLPQNRPNVASPTPEQQNGPIPTSVSTQQIAQQNSSDTTTQPANAATATMITLDPTALKAMTSFNEAFGGYVTQLAGIKIPDKVTISGNYTVDLKISGAAAIEALDKKIKEIGETFVSATDFTTALNGLRDEVSRAMPRAIKPSSTKGTTG